MFDVYILNAYYGHKTNENIISIMEEKIINFNYQIKIEKNKYFKINLLTLTKIITHTEYELYLLIATREGLGFKSHFTLTFPHFNRPLWSDFQTTFGAEYPIIVLQCN